MIKHYSEPDDLYEKIVRHAFKCPKYGDPLSLAKQEVYNHNYEDVGFPLKMGLSYALYKMSTDMKSPDLEELSKDVWSAKNQSEVIKIMSEVVNIVNLDDE